MNASTASPLDARIVRTRTQLRKAALSLAADSPIADVSVSDLTRAAGINRATFYKHAQSPSEVLEEALLEDLNQMREGFLIASLDSPSDFETTWRRAVEDTVKHVERFESVYTHGFTESSDGSLKALLARHISTSMVELFHSSPELIPNATEESFEFFVNAYAAAIGASLTAVLGAWLGSPDRDIEKYAIAVLNVLPDWMRNSSANEVVQKTEPQASLENL